MPYLQVNGAKLYYEVSGDGPETVVFSHGLLMSGGMFADQAAALASRYRCIRYDHRGQGRSEVTDSGYDMDALADDAAKLIEALDAAPCHFVGLSMGGFVGMRLALSRPELLRSLVLMDTSADPEPNRKPYRRLAFVGRWLGFRPVVDRVMNIMFGRSFLEDPARAAVREHWRQHLLSLDRRGTYRAAHGVIDRDGVYQRISGIATPTLIMVGEEDVATVPEKSERMQHVIPGARLVRIPGAGHSASIEQPERVTDAVRSFLESLPAGPE
jgi:pimeloyl-ACP methyl ester carboxylesterase